MLMKIKNGAILTVNGQTFRVSETSMERVTNDGASDKASFTAVSIDGQQTLVIEFSPTTIAIDERDLKQGIAGLMTLLSNG